MHYLMHYLHDSYPPTASMSQDWWFKVFARSPAWCPLMQILYGFLRQAERVDAVYEKGVIEI